ncbi:conserved hypothetical protein [Uncinocarpus reesii 1704]|uniref:RTA1 domain protein n=1 Tax=Uncinocarpus reesii (strain UAMH 1704) TaxID=336963 RepID=C4JU74_UNCRE|nr:uncharacterized protein UREG_06013 [Uncinocarpus reesii 1704]EEP81171.1 conserved hypothetical protein [Uncinocarpus reesii 1704]
MAAPGEPILGSLYIYAPNKVAPVIFTVLYGISAGGHIWQCYHYKAWRMIGLHPLCAVVFTAGYALREYGAFNYLYDHSTLNLITFIVSQVLIYVCPPLLELSNYHVLGRILYYVPYFAPFPANRVLSTFGGLMAIVEILNSLGVSLKANPSSSSNQQHLGGNLTIAAISIQIGIIVIFLILAGLFHLRCVRANIRPKPIITPLFVLYASMMLILVRCVYRLVEHLGNTTVDLDSIEKLRALSPILRYEYYFYIFESTLMFLNSALWNIWHPGRYLPQNYHIHLAEDGRTEINDEFKDDRPLLAKAGHVLTFGVFFGKNMKHHRVPHQLNNYPPNSP